MPKKRNFPVARKPYLEPRIARGKKIYRGEIKPQHMPRFKRAGELKIDFLNDGRVKVVYYHETAPGKLEVRGKHMLESLGGEFRKERAIQSELAALHATIFDSWSKMNNAQRLAVKEFLLGLVDELQPRYQKYSSMGLNERSKIKRYRLERLEKKLAVQRINLAIDLLEKNNKGAACAALVGASNSLIAQMGSVLRQEAFSRRRKKALFRQMTREEEHVFKTINAMSLSLEIIERPNISIESLESRLKQHVNALTVLQKRHAPFSTAVRQLVEAIKLVREGSLSEAAKKIQKARQLVEFTASQRIIFSKQRLNAFSKASSKRRTAIVAQQLQLFGENVVYWHEKASIEQRNNMRSWLTALQRLLIGTSAEPLRSSIINARNALAENPVKAKEILLEAVQEIRKKK